VGGERRCVVETMNKPIIKPAKPPRRKPKLNGNYKPKRIFLETLIGYQEAALTKPIDSYGEI